MFLKLPHGHASVVISQKLSLSKTSLHNYADLFLNVAVFFPWALGNDEVMTPLWLKSSMSALSVHSNCSSFVSLKTNFKVSHLAYIHHNSVIIAVTRCPTYAVRLGVFRCFDCKNLIDINWMIPESISMLQRERWWNNSCSDWGFFFFFLAPNQICCTFYLSPFLILCHIIPLCRSHCVLTNMAVPGSSPNCDDQTCAGWLGVAAWQMQSSGWPGLKWRWLAAAHVPQLGLALAPEVRAPVTLMSG